MSSAPKRLTKDLFWQTWPKVLARGLRSRAAIRTRDGCCPLVAVARELGMPQAKHLQRFWALWRESRVPRWAYEVAHHSDIPLAGSEIRRRLLQHHQEGPATSRRPNEPPSAKGENHVRRKE
jgi:hypothetical protein